MSFPVVPGQSLGEFSFGMNLRQALDILSISESSAPTVDIIYSEETPFEVPVVFRLFQQGVRLEFHPVTQLLVRIVVYDSSKIRLTYNNQQFSGPPTVATLASIYQLFGPTFPGTFHTDTGQYELVYPGAHFFFPIPEAHQHLYMGDNADLPLQLPDGSTPVPSSIVFLPEHSEPFTTSYRSLVMLGRGVSLLSHPTQPILLGDSVQYVLTVLGAPQHIHPKSTDLMRIHARPPTGPVPARPLMPRGAAAIDGPLMPRGAAGDASDGDDGGDANPSGDEDEGLRAPPHRPPPQPQPQPWGVQQSRVLLASSSAALSTCGASGPAGGAPGGVSSPDYFYNYTDMGVDLLFDGMDHVVKKMVLHANLPGHVDFALYNRFSFVIREPGKAPLTEASKITQISAVLGPLPTPIVHSKPVVASPFSTTRFYGFGQAIFEVMRNGHICSVTLF
ncbi:putative UPF0183 protein [Paratrimastix pyriformis]|uniref:UPF0183 protein n=1 Tax=Paratrimastix pyriformis TaxID=342808 RepID=A0ABQ8V0K7_9EUKA|nr:putative UPF0183 protein [Paratrimastix pyriformis]